MLTNVINSTIMVNRYELEVNFANATGRSLDHPNGQVGTLKSQCAGTYRHEVGGLDEQRKVVMLNYQSQRTLFGLPLVHLASGQVVDGATSEGSPVAGSLLVTFLWASSFPSAALPVAAFQSVVSVWA